MTESFYQFAHLDAAALRQMCRVCDDESAQHACGHNLRVCIYNIPRIQWLSRARILSFDCIPVVHSRKVAHGSMRGMLDVSFLSLSRAWNIAGAQHAPSHRVACPRHLVDPINTELLESSGETKHSCSV